MWEAFFGFKKTPFSDCPDPKQLFTSAAWQQVTQRLEFLVQHHGVGLLTGEVGAGKSTAARVFTAALNPGLFKILYVHFSSGTALDLLRQIALTLDLEPRTIVAIWCGRLPMPLCASTKARSSIRCSSSTRPTCYRTRRWSNCRCC